jgi:uncharacterized membrane protein
MTAIGELVETPLEYAAECVELIGIAILLITAVRFLFHYIAFETARVRGMKCVFQIRDMRLRLGSYLLLALEFMIISDIIHTALKRTLDDFFVLGILVVIRSALSFFLSLDLKETREEISER